ncbi:hypothetical protein G7Y89_g1027 [Cudoniella acicularis]|uniref:Uncharacterized protein n=1 Tax=Cudoniella acicularis TaxID=354080 RepID=A0A8H4W7D5_9HELO|nr:hypothetical protein G7Y89_g1027 [Cudoniella acicularis]
MSTTNGEDETPGLSFINLTGNQRATDPHINKTVRAYVMSRYRRQKRTERQKGTILKPSLPKLGFYKATEREKKSVSEGKNDEHNVTVPPEQQHELTMKDFSPSRTVQWNSKDDWRLTGQNDDDNPLEFTFEMLVDFRFTPLDGMADPFNVMCLPSSPRLLSLLQHHLTAPIRTSVHADPTERYRSYCTEDCAWLYMTISYTASRMNPRNPESEFYLAKSISLLNENLADPEKQASDSTIATVACLANMENLNGTVNSARIHVSGLQKMVQLRGGLSNLGQTSVMQPDQTQHPSSYSFLFPTHRRFPPSTPTPQHHNHPSNSLPALIDAISNKSSYSYRKLPRRLQDLHDLAMFLNHTNGTRKDGELPPSAAYPDRVYTVEHKILTCLAQESNASIDTPEAGSGILSLLLHASPLYIYTNLRQTPVGGQIRKSILTRLKTKLQISEIEYLAQIYPAEVLWMLVLGVMGSNAEDEWFIKKSRELCSALGLFGWTNVVRFLDGKAPGWERECAARCERFWVSVVNVAIGCLCAT